MTEEGRTVASPTKAPLPRFVSLTPAMEQSIDELLERIRATFDPLPPMFQQAMKRTKPGTDTPHNATRLYAYAYLQSREWKVEKAFQMIESVTKFRALHRLDERQFFPSAFSLRGWSTEGVLAFLRQEPREKDRIDTLCKGIGLHFSFGLHFWDKQGLPVIYLLVGSVDEVELLKKLKQLANIGQAPEEVFWEFMQYCIGVGEVILRYQQYCVDEGLVPEGEADASEGLLRNFTVVVDMRGFSYSMLRKSAVDLFRSVVRNIFLYYTDSVHRIVVVRAPSVVQMAYSVVKGVFNKQVQRKVSFFTEHQSLAALENIIHRKYIPSFLGGECSCPGHCISTYDPLHPRPKRAPEATDEGEPATENVKLSAGHRCERVVALKQGQAVVWEFLALHHSEVQFSVYFTPSAPDETAGADVGKRREEMNLVQSYSSTGETGTYTASVPGTLALVWSNQKSWISSKSIQFQLHKHDLGSIQNTSEDNESSA